MKFPQTDNEKQRHRDETNWVRNKTNAMQFVVMLLSRQVSDISELTKLTLVA